MQRGSLSADPPPPTLPPRPGGRPLKPVRAVPVDASGLQEPDAVYDDCNESNGLPPKPDDVYDDCVEKNAPPPLPAHPEAFYDDLGEQQSAPPPPLPPQRPQPPVPLMSPPQDVYDDLGGPIVQQLPKRQLPPAPVQSPPAPTGKAPASSVYEFDDANDEVDAQNQPPLPPPPPPSMLEDQRAIYEVEPEPSGEPEPPAVRQAPAPPPHLPPKSPGFAKQPSQPAKSITSPGPKGGGSSSGFALNLGVLQNAMAGLKRVSVDSDPSDSSQDGKVYGDCPETVYDAKKLFQNKAAGKPGPPKQSSFEKVHARSPSPPAPAPQKPVSRFEPKQEELEAPEDIYDDATSFIPDPMARYDWYHGKIERTDGERRVRTFAKDGTFLVRISEKDPNFPYTLVVLHKGQVNNLQIRQRSDTKVALGKEKTGEVAFKDVPTLVDHHRKHPVVLLGNNQSQVKLQHTPPKS